MKLTIISIGFPEEIHEIIVVSWTVGEPHQLITDAINDHYFGISLLLVKYFTNKLTIPYILWAKYKEVMKLCLRPISLKHKFFHFVWDLVDKMDVFSSRVREITDKFIEIPEEFHNLLVNLSTADGERSL